LLLSKNDVIETKVMFYRSGPVWLSTEKDIFINVSML